MLKTMLNMPGPPLLAGPVEMLRSQGVWKMTKKTTNTHGIELTVGSVKALAAVLIGKMLA